MNIGSLEVLLGVNTAGLSRAAVNMRRFESQVLGSNGRMQASFQALGSQMMLTGTMLTQFFTAPIALLFGASAKMFSDYEKSLSRIVGLTDFSSEQVKKMAGEILALSTKVNKSPKELAEGLYFIGSSGIKDTALAMDILKKSSTAATVGLGETKSVADALTSVLNAYGHESITAGKATDILIAAVREGKGEADALTRVIGHVMPLAVQLGVSFDEVAGSLASLTLTGKSASEASTQLARLFTTLIQAPPEAEKALEKMGISFSDLRRILREGGMLPMIQSLRRMIGGNTIDVLQNSKAYEDNITVLGDVFTNIRALLPVLDMVGPNFANTARVMEATAQSAGALDRSAKSVADTMYHRWGNATKSLSVSMIQLGETIKEPLIRIFQQLTSFINNLIASFIRLPSAQKEAILSFVALAAVAGPALIVLGQLSGAIMAFGRALFSLSLLGWITKLLVLAAAIYLIYKNWNLLTSIVEKFEMKKAIAQMEMSQRSLAAFSTKWASYLSVLKETGKVTGDAAKTVDTLIQKESELATLQGKMDSIPTTEYDAREDMYTKISSKLNEIYELRQKLTKVGGDSRNDKAMASILEDMLAMEKKLASYSVDIKMFDDAKNEAIDFKEIFNQVLSSIGEGMVSLQKKLLGIDFSNIGGGYGLGDLDETKMISSVKAMQKRALSLMPQTSLKLPEIVGPDQDAFIVQNIKVLEVVRNANLELDQHRKLLELLGPGYKKAEADAATLSKAISEMTGSELAPFLDPASINTLMQYMESLDKVDKKQKNIFRGLKELVGGFADIINSYGNLMDSKKQKELDWIDTIAKKQHKSDLWIAKEKDKINAAYSKKMKAIAIAQAVINGALAITNIWAHTIDVTGVGIKIAASALSAANTAIQIATISGTKMARGGVVPNGFPNDSFPAMLTSGETVIPLNRLNEIAGKDVGNGGGEVVFRIDGFELVGILQKMGKLQKAY